MIPTAEEQPALVIDEAREGNQVVKHEGTRCFLVGAALANAVEGLALDCRDTDEGRQFTTDKLVPES